MSRENKAKYNRLAGRKAVVLYYQFVGRQLLPVKPPSTRTEDGGDRMTDYELIMIVLTILSLLIAVDLKNRK